MGRGGEVVEARCGGHAEAAWLGLGLGLGFGPGLRLGLGLGFGSGFGFGFGFGFCVGFGLETMCAAISWSKPRRGTLRMSTVTW